MIFAPDDLWKQQLKNGKIFLDVRAPVEFKDGHIPFAKNIAILNDDERAQVGTEYKKNGQDAAIILGHQIVSDENKKNKLSSWIEWAKENPEGIIYCFRGGKRSELTQNWLSELNIQRLRIEGGYKRVRQFLIDSTNQIEHEKTAYVIGGLTGSGKTILLNSFSPKNKLDLEGLAHHKGSSFGAGVFSQPSQTQFENELSQQLLNTDKKILLENESRLVGSLILPLAVYEKIQSSPIVTLVAPLEIRVENIFKDYILGLWNEYEKLNLPQHEIHSRILTRHQNSIDAIKKKLGGLQHSVVRQQLQAAFQPPETEVLKLHLHEPWIKSLLTHYYDPLYFKHEQKNEARIIFKGDIDESRNYLRSILADS